MALIPVPVIDTIFGHFFQILFVSKKKNQASKPIILLLFISLQHYEQSMSNSR